MAPSINWVWPTKLPTGGGEIRVSVSNATGTSPAVTVGGVACSILGNGLGSYRVSVPAHSAGAADLSYSDSGGSATAAGAVTFVATLSRLYLARLNQDSAGINLPRPASAGCIATVSAGSVTSPATNVLSSDLSTTAAPYATAISITPGGSTGQFGGAGGFVSGMLKGISKIEAATWTFAALAYRNNATSGFTNFDKLCLYVYRPSTGAVVGKVFDNTGSYTHPAGTLTGSGTSQRQWINFTISGAEVAGVQDGDVLVLEVLCCADATHAPNPAAFYFNGVDAIGSNGAFTSSASAAAYIESDHNLFPVAETSSSRPQMMVVT